MSGPPTFPDMVLFDGLQAELRALELAYELSFATKFNVQDTAYAGGAKGDAQTKYNASMATGGTVVTATGAGFVEGDVGKTIVVVGAGITGGYNCLLTTISGYTDASHVTVALAATVAVSNAKMFWGTDDTAAVIAANTALQNAGEGWLYFPNNQYIVSQLPSWSPLFSNSPLTYAMEGDGPGSRIYFTGSTVAASHDVSNPAFDPNNPSNGSPVWSGYIVDGVASDGGACGLIFGDVSYPVFRDVVYTNFGTGTGFMAYNQYGWTEGVQWDNVSLTYNAIQVDWATGLGHAVGTLGATVSSGTSGVTSITVSPSTFAMYDGQPFVISSGSGTLTQTLKTTANVSVGDTTIHVQAFTAAQTYTSGTASAFLGAFESFQYWTIKQFYLDAFANQHGWVEEVPLGVNQRIQHRGSTFRGTGNLQSGATNTGIAFWLKGNSQMDATWDVSIEGDGSTTYHKGIQCDTNTSLIIGGGRFELSSLLASTFNGGVWQFSIAGSIDVTAISGSSPTYNRVAMRNAQWTNYESQSTSYTPTIASGTAFMNPDPWDYDVDLAVTFTSAGTWKENFSMNSGVGAGPVAYAYPAGVAKITYHHYANQYRRFDWTNVSGVVIAEVRI